MCKPHANTPPTGVKVRDTDKICCQNPIVLLWGKKEKKKLFITNFWGFRLHPC